MQNEYDYMQFNTEFDSVFGFNINFAICASLYDEYIISMHFHDNCTHFN